MCVCVCVCVCLFVCARKFICAQSFICVCVCVCMSVYVCVCVCACMCVEGREGGACFLLHLQDLFGVSWSKVVQYLLKLIK